MELHINCCCCDHDTVQDFVHAINNDEYSEFIQQTDFVDEIKPF